MGEILQVKYKCQHPSCVVNCREGVLTIEEEYFTELKEGYGDALFKSPRGVCRMGFSQPFMAVSVERAPEEEEDAAAVKEARETLSPDDPIGALMAEHEVVLKKLEEIREQIRIRDVEALWVSTAELENHVTLHSIKKEEEAFFPLLHDLLPFADGLVAIVKEEHRELMSLLHSFRNGLVDGDIMDGIIGSVITNLQSHIRKEDYEFFELINSTLNPEIRARILEAMKKVEREFVPMEPGLRSEATSLSKERELHDRLAQEAREETMDSATGGKTCCGH